MYANYENPGFDSTKQYAFLRSGKKEFILVVVNFGEQTANVSINIPEEALDYINIEPHKIKQAEELLSKKKITLGTQWENPICIGMEAHSAKIIKFSML